MSVGINNGGGLPESAEWFKLHHDQVFDWLALPNDSDLMRLFRHEAAARILCNLKDERWQGVRFMYDGLFIEEMRDLLEAHGCCRPAGVDRFSLLSLKSSDCFKRIWNFATSLSIGYARRISDTTPEGLENEPCYELLTNNEMWKERWIELGGKLYDEERMIAHKLDLIWVGLSDFKLPWPPLNLQCEADLDLVGVDINEAERLGIQMHNC